MSRAQSALAAAFLFAGLAFLTYFVSTLLGPLLATTYREAAGFSTARTVAQAAGFLTMLGLLVAGFVVAVPVALRPGGWGRKLLYMVPAWLLAVTALGFVTALVGIGRVGRLDLGLGLGRVDLVSHWLLLGGLLSTAGVSVAAARVSLTMSTIGRAIKVLAVTAVPLVMTWLALVGSLLVASTSQPSLGGPGGAPPGALTQPGAPAAAGRPAAAPGTVGAAAQGQPARPAPDAQAPGGPAGPAGPGAAPGPGGAGGTARRDPAAVLRQQWLLAGLMAALGAVFLWAIARARRALREGQPLAVAASLDDATAAGSGQLGRTAVAAVALTGIVLLAIQLVPVSRTNPPVVTPPPWDSPQTMQLWDRACADCHSNVTIWPWYAYVAPTSWLTTIDTNNGRRGLNVSQITDLSEEDLAELPAGVKRRIENRSMPPREYMLLHPAARLTEAEKQQLIEGIARTYPSGQ